jgi:predicted transcriptional regulator
LIKIPHLPAEPLHEREVEIVRSLHPANRPCYKMTLDKLEEACKHSRKLVNRYAQSLKEKGVLVNEQGVGYYLKHMPPQPDLD